MDEDAQGDQDNADTPSPVHPPDGSPRDPPIPPNEEEEKEDDNNAEDKEYEESKDPQDKDDLPEDPEQEQPGKYYSPRTWKGKALSKMFVFVCSCNLLQHNADVIVETAKPASKSSP
jgi:hypothetical protein